MSKDCLVCTEYHPERPPCSINQPPVCRACSLSKHAYKPQFRENIPHKDGSRECQPVPGDVIPYLAQEATQPRRSAEAQRVFLEQVLGEAVAPERYLNGQPGYTPEVGEGTRIDERVTASEVVRRQNMAVAALPPSRPVFDPATGRLLYIPGVAPRNSMPDNDALRALSPMADGLLDYFPNALAYVAEVSKRGSDKHNAGQPMHWARGKSTDHRNKILRHLADTGGKCSEGVRHTGNLAWRALALLQEELEREEGYPVPRGSRME